MLPEYAHEQSAAPRWERAPECYRPDYQRSLNCVLPTVFALLEQSVPDAPILQPFLPSASWAPAKKVFLLCVDALGYKVFAQSLHLSKLYASHGTWITSTFPSITSCALSSLYQALPPSRHGILGHQIWKDSPGAIVDMLRMKVVGAKASLEESGFDLNQWKREPGLLDGAHGRDIPARHIMPQAIVSSGLSTHSYGKIERVGCMELLEGFSKAGRMLEQPGRGWIGLYTPLVDTLNHVLGGTDPYLGLGLRHIEEALYTMIATLSPRTVAETTLVMVGDHGQADIHTTIPLYGKPLEDLQAHCRALGFSGRVLHIYLGDHPAEPMCARLRELVGEKGRLWNFEEAAELVGPGGDADWVRRSLGDVLVVLNEGFNWEKQESEKNPYATRLRSQHGAMSWNEMVIPLLCAPFSALG